MRIKVLSECLSTAKVQIDSQNTEDSFCRKELLLNLFQIVQLPSPKKDRPYAKLCSCVSVLLLWSTNTALELFMDYYLSCVIIYDNWLTCVRLS